MDDVAVACLVLGFRVTGETILDIISERVLWIVIVVFMGNFGIDGRSVHGMCDWTMSVGQWRFMGVDGRLCDDASTSGSDECAECKELEIKYFQIKLVSIVRQTASGPKNEKKKTPRKFRQK